MTEHHKAGLKLGGIAALIAIASSLEFNVEQAIQKEKEEARIYSSKCLRQDKDWIAKQADSSKAKWKVDCVKTIRL